jgi:hypothetical protein
LKALKLDEAVAEAHHTLAEVKKKGYDLYWAAAEAEYKRTLQLTVRRNGADRQWRENPSM